MMVMRSTSPTFYTPPFSQGANPATMDDVRREYDTRPTIVISPPPRPARESFPDVLSRVNVPTPLETESEDEESIEESIEESNTGRIETTNVEESYTNPQQPISNSRKSSSDEWDDNSVSFRGPPLSRTDSAPADDWSHRRARSHFSIPDVIVTSSAEEGEEVHFEHQVEPTRRKTSLPSLLFQNSIESVPNSKTSTRPKSPVVRHDEGVASTAKKSAKAKPKPLNLANSQTKQETGKGTPTSASPMSPTIPTTSSNKEDKPMKRARKSSFPSLFSKKDRDVANAHAAVVLPPSPIIQQQPALPQSPITPSSAQSSSSPISSFFPNSPISSSYTASAPTSPSLASNIPPSPTSIRSFSKKEIKAKVKEEKNLIKELEKIDKMVRKHDEKAQRAARKASVEELRVVSTSSSAAKEGKAKRVLQRMSVFRPSTSSVNKIQTRGNIAEVEVDMRARNGFPPLEKVASSPTKAHLSKAKESDESERGSHSAWTTDQWTDVPSPMEEQLSSLTSKSPIKSEDDPKSTVEAETPTKINVSLQRKESNASRALAKMEAERALRRRISSTHQSSNSNGGMTVANKRRSVQGKQFKLGLNFIEGSEMGWEDSVDSPVRSTFNEKDGQVTPTPKDYNSGLSKRSTLLESLYKDLDEMESTLRKERGVVAATSSPPPISRTNDREPELVVKRSELSSSPQIKSRPSNDSSNSSLASDSIDSSTPSSPQSNASISSPSSPERPTRRSRIGHNPKGFQFPASPPIDKTIRTKLQRTDSTPNKDRTDDQTVVVSSMSKSTSSPSQFL